MPRIRFTPVVWCRLSAAIFVFVLSACSTEPHQSAVEKGTVVYSWEAKGSMVFLCDYDEGGLYWKFIHPEGRLLDQKGVQVADLLPDFGIKARDGSQIAARIVEQTNASSATDIKPALFEVSSSTDGMLKDMRYVERNAPKGGMPLVGCSPSQRGKVLKVPFSARYLFYR